MNKIRVMRLESGIVALVLVSERGSLYRKIVRLYR